MSGLREAAQDVARFWSKVDQSDADACWPWTGGERRGIGYGRVWWMGRKCSAHRVAYELAYGQIPAGLHVCHRCDNPPCCNPAHLFLGTVADNNADALAKGRRAVPVKPGTTNGRAKLTEAQVREIRSLRGVVGQRVLAERFGVDRKTVWEAQTGKGWPHV